MNRKALTIPTELVRRGLTMSEVATQCSATSNVVSRVAAGLGPSRKIERFLCQLIDLRRLNLFSSRKEAQIVIHEFESTHAA